MLSPSGSTKSRPPPRELGAAGGVCGCGGGAAEAAEMEVAERPSAAANGAGSWWDHQPRQGAYLDDDDYDDDPYHVPGFTDDEEEDYSEYSYGGEQRELLRGAEPSDQQPGSPGLRV